MDVASGSTRPVPPPAPSSYGRKDTVDPGTLHANGIGSKRQVSSQPSMTQPTKVSSSMDNGKTVMPDQRVLTPANLPSTTKSSSPAPEGSSNGSKAINEDNPLDDGTTWEILSHISVDDLVAAGSRRMSPARSPEVSRKESLPGIPLRQSDQHASTGVPDGFTAVPSSSAAAQTEARIPRSPSLDMIVEFNEKYSDDGLGDVDDGEAPAEKPEQKEGAVCFR